jgi:ribosomal protein S18 acetylase RimI-like enzyme
VLAALTTLRRRQFAAEDEQFASELFASSRPDLAALPAAVRESLVTIQFRAQRAEYAASYPDAQHEVVVIDGVDVAALIVDHGSSEVRIVDITVHPAHREQGIGSALLGEEIARAASAGMAVALSVWSGNVAARRLYERLGFVVVSNGDGYLEMRQDNIQGRSGQ